MSAAAGSVTYGAPMYGPWRPLGGAPAVPGMPGGLTQEAPSYPTGTPTPIPGPPPPVNPAAAEEGAPITRPVTIVKLPRPKYASASHEFYGAVPKQDSTFAWSEMCATPEPDSALAPAPPATKMWYNSYVYVPEQCSHTERHFLDRFVQGADGEWVDVVKARRLATHIEEHREKALADRMERAMVMSGNVVQETRYTDPYSGEPLVVCRGELLPRQQLYERYDGHYASGAMREQAAEAQGAFDFDNLRVAWPFGRPYRNKVVSQHVYDGFDRQSPYLPTDRSYQILELPSMYVDQAQYERGGQPARGPGVQGYRQDPNETQRVQYIQM
mmetsp:Transcript_84394/g.243603  ORF Transcript_84394/g.243603 Transcript_84394/m.243603 type:complete len:328 (+) Transcript_84394:105-1088(+)